MSDNPFLDFRLRYVNDVELFVREAFQFPNEAEKAAGKDIYPWQRRVMQWYNARERRISVRSGHGVGKSTLLAWLTWHHLLTRYPQKTAVTAPTEKQLFDAYWAEFKAWGKRLPPVIQQFVDVKADRAEFVPARESSFVTIATARADQPEALQGKHSEWVLLIADEASGVPEQVFEAASGSMSGHNAITVLTGNPVRGQGYFFDTHGKLSEFWKTDTVSCLDVPGVSEDFAKEIEQTYGRESNTYRVRVLGLPPTRDDDTVIPFELVEAALSRDIILPKTAPVIWGVDPARFGSDRSALAKRQTRQLLEPVKWWSKLDTMELASRINQEYDATPQWLRPLEINVDAIGIGAGVVDRLRQLRLPARGVNVSESPAAMNMDKYANLRAELWFKMREWFESRDCRVPESYGKTRAATGDDLVGELSRVRYKFRPASGKIAVESKDEMRKRGMRSPDLADAFMLTFASDAIALQHGRFASTSWGQKLSRPLKALSGV